ncbi:acyl-CoA thioester hydrolase/BAAT C-terminal domain-containing protein [Neptunicella sp.]|uniref:acyl-CoA thioester hydrolase/BAAT C-terminal domain-containing protein n=1 Tax=Neptunicella sp. TaxID=2125986 RepID=UPI003F68D596
MKKIIPRIFIWCLGLLLIPTVIVLSFELLTEWLYDEHQLPKNYGKVQTELHLGKGKRQPLIVALGGSEGGNSWNASVGYRKFLNERGYAFLPIAYFGLDGIPEKLDRIALNGVHEAVLNAAKNPNINENCIAIIGVSKGAELALLLASYYPEYKAVVALSPSNVNFTSTTNPMVKISFPLVMDTPSFSIDGKSLPFVPASWKAKLKGFSGDFLGFYEDMLANKSAVKLATIKVENINGAIFMVSGKYDNLWPSSAMSEMMMARLTLNNFSHHFEHLEFDGDHYSWGPSMVEVDDFLSEQIMSKNNLDCR